MKLIISAVVLISSVSYALSCADPRKTFPQDGASDVPTNVKLRIIFSNENERFISKLVRTADQVEVPLEARDEPGKQVTFTPTTMLEPRTRYTIVSLGEQNQTFTTGDGEDTEAHAAVDFKGATFQNLGSVTNLRLWSLDLEGGSDNAATRENLVLLAEHEGRVVGATALSDPALRTSECGENFSPPGSSFELSLRVVDLAGNVSAPSSPQQVAGCNAAPGGALLMLALASLIRRRR